MDVPVPLFEIFKELIETSNLTQFTFVVYCDQYLFELECL